MSTPINSYPIPPTFIGVAPLPWLYDCARLCSIHEIPAHDYVDFAWGGLSGAAAMWFDDWGLKRSLESIGWEEFSEAVLCRFGTSTQSSSTYQVFDEIIETRLNFPPATSMAPFVQRFEIGIAESLDLIFQDQYQDPKFALFVESPLRELLVWVIIPSSLFAVPISYFLLLDINCFKNPFTPSKFGFSFGFKGGGNVMLLLWNWGLHIYLHHHNYALLSYVGFTEPFKDMWRCIHLDGSTNFVGCFVVGMAYIGGANAMVLQAECKPLLCSLRGKV